jgi:hypothetical protein
MYRLKNTAAIMLAGSVAFTSVPAAFAAQMGDPPSPFTAQYAAQTPEQLDQLVAPIALYPDALVAQILAASAYPAQIADAERYMQQNPGLQGAALAQSVDQQSWQPSVKALTEFPAVLANMDRNASWTMALGDAYANRGQDVMSAVQVMRQRAQQAGNLNTDSHQKVTAEGNTIAIEPADSQIVYVPMYDPWFAYGSPLVAWPGWYGYPGLFWDGPGIGFGLGYGIGFFGSFGWGFGHWGADWHHGAIGFHDHAFGRGVIGRGFHGGRGVRGHAGHAFHGGFHGGGFRGGRGRR